MLSNKLNTRVNSLLQFSFNKEHIHKIKFNEENGEIMNQSYKELFDKIPYLGNIRILLNDSFGYTNPISLFSQTFGVPDDNIETDAWTILILKEIQTFFLLDKSDSYFYIKNYTFEKTKNDQVINIINNIFGEHAQIETNYKIYAESQNKLQSFYQIELVRREGHIHNLQLISYLEDFPAWHDHVFIDTLINAIYEYTGISFSVEDIKPENISDISDQINAILY